MPQYNGIPQGSTLSATLFNIAINDITKYIPKPIKSCLYADDLIIYHTGKNNAMAKHLLQKTINMLEKWTHRTGFKFSPSKTKIIHFSKRQAQKNIDITLNNTIIEQVNYIKYLGLTFDRKLTWKEHIRQLKNNCLKKKHGLHSGSAG